MTVKFGADTTQFTKGLDRMQKKTKSTASSIKSSMARMLGAGLIVAGLRSITQELDRAGKMAQRFGTDAVTIQKLGVVAELNGTSFERMAKALTDANRAAEEAESGMQRQADAFKAMGINANEFISMGLQEQLTALSDGFIKADKRGQGFSNAQIIMGGSAKELLVTLRQGSEAINEQAAAAAAASNETVDSVQDMNDAWTKNKKLMVEFTSIVFDRVGKGIPIFMRVGDAIMNGIVLVLDLALLSIGHVGDAIMKLMTGDFAGAKASMGKIGEEAAKSVDRAVKRVDENNAKRKAQMIDAEIAAKVKGLQRAAKIEDDLAKKGFEVRKRIHFAKVKARAEAEAKEEEDAKTKVATKSPRVTKTRGRGQEISSLASMGGGRGFLSTMSSLTKVALQGNKILKMIERNTKTQGGLA